MTMTGFAPGDPLWLFVVGVDPGQVTRVLVNGADVEWRPSHDGDGIVVTILASEVAKVLGVQITSNIGTTGPAGPTATGP